MPVPKRKRSRVRRDKRFANKGIKAKAVTVCKTCAAPSVPHVVCALCGHYKGIKVMVTKQDRAEKRAVVLQAKSARGNGKKEQQVSSDSQASQ